VSLGLDVQPAPGWSLSVFWIRSAAAVIAGGRAGARWTCAL